MREMNNYSRPATNKPYFVPKLFLIISLAVVFRIVLVVVVGEDPIGENMDYSLLVKTIGFKPVIVGMFYICYFALAIVFLVVQKNLAGTKLQKGCIYGTLFALLWTYGMLEAGIIKQTSLPAEIIFGISEGLPIVLLGVLSGIFFGTNSTRKLSHTLNASYWFALFPIVELYLFGRYFAYIVIEVESAYVHSPLATFLWTGGNAVLIAILYSFYRNAFPAYNSFAKALLFGLVVFGLNWALYNFLVPVIFQVSVFEVFRSFFLRVLVDIVAIVTGVFLAEEGGFLINGMYSNDNYVFRLTKK